MATIKKNPSYIKSKYKKFLFRMGKLIPSVLAAAYAVNAEKMFIVE